MTPSRAHSIEDLDPKLDQWMLHVRICGLDIPEWGKTLGLRSLVPEKILETLKQSTTLVTFEEQLEYVKGLIRDRVAVQEALAVGQAVAGTPGSSQSKAGDSRGWGDAQELVRTRNVE